MVEVVAWNSVIDVAIGRMVLVMIASGSEAVIVVKLVSEAIPTPSTPVGRFSIAVTNSSGYSREAVVRPFARIASATATSDDSLVIKSLSSGMV